MAEKNVRAWVAVPVVVGAGALLFWAGLFDWFGTLPGDIRAEREGTRVNIPFTSLVVVTVILSAVVQVVYKLVSR